MPIPLVAALLLLAPGDEPLRRELLGMVEVDQAARVAMMKTLGEKGVPLAGGQPITDPATLKIMAEASRRIAEVDRAHRDRLKAIVERHGWPGKALVGADGAHAAWLIVQHADDEPDLQARYLKLMESAPPGEVEGKDVAYLTDRVLVGRRQPQRYGTQLGPDFAPMPIEDEPRVDERRKAVGLPPLAEYIKAARAEYAKLMAPPTR